MMRERLRSCGVAPIGLLLAAGLCGCSEKEPADYTFAPISAYVSCTSNARAGLDANRISFERAAEIVDRFDPQLQTAAQAMAYRRGFEGQPLENGAQPTAKQHFETERKLLRELAICATSAEADRKLCPRVD